MTTFPGTYMQIAFVGLLDIPLSFQQESFQCQRQSDDLLLEDLSEPVIESCSTPLFPLSRVFLLTALGVDAVSDSVDEQRIALFSW